MPRRRSELVVISWRDIPAQVNAHVGADKHQVVLPRRFRARSTTPRWSRARRPRASTSANGAVPSLAIPADGGIDAAAESEAQRLDESFPPDRLQRFVANGGWDPDATEPAQ